MSTETNFHEITLHGDRALQERRVRVLTNESLKYRINDPERYFLLRNIALEIQDQLEPDEG